MKNVSVFIILMVSRNNNYMSYSMSMYTFKNFIDMIVAFMVWKIIIIMYNY